MRANFFLRLVIGLSLLSLGLMAEIDRVAGQAGGREMEGIYQGTLETTSRKLRLVLKITVSSDGNLTATLDSPDQRLKNLPLEGVIAQDQVLRFEFRAGQARYRGQISTDGNSIEGEWSQAGQSRPLHFLRTDKEIEIAARRQTPLPPFPYRVEEVSYENRGASVKLAATLTLPQGNGPFPAAILLTVAGPNDRDQTHFDHKPYAVLADYLTRRGIAVLRADDRGIGGSTGKLFESTIADFAEDALAGMAYLKSRSEIDAQRIGFIGNSEGTIVGPLAAMRAGDAAFVVMLGGLGVSGAQAIRGQVETLAAAENFSPEQIQKLLARTDALFQILLEEKDDAKAIARLKPLLNDRQVAMPASSRILMPADLDAQSRLLVSPWYRYQIAYNPKPVLMKLQCPVLAITGSKDLFLNPQQNLPAIEEALMQGGNPDFTITQLPNLNHVFQTAKTGSPVEYATIEESFSPLALQTIGDWLAARILPAKQPPSSQSRASQPASLAEGVSQTVFDFRISFWLNLHHVLYEQARRQSVNKKAAGGRQLPNLIDSARLTQGEQKVWQAALSFYEASMIQRDLLFDDSMTEIKLRLSERAQAADLQASGLPKELVVALEQAAPIYRQHWWPEHQQANDAFIEKASQLISRFGSALPKQLERLFQAKWPEGRIKVDVVRYANWAGAFTTNDPATHITIASLDDRHKDYLALEILFHEASHALVGNQIGAVGEGIARECRAQNKTAPRDLWHAVLFYTTGEMVKRRLAEEGIRDYQPYAYRQGLYTRSWPQLIRPLEQYWQPYLEGKVTFDHALRDVVAAL